MFEETRLASQPRKNSDASDFQVETFQRRCLRSRRLTPHVEECHLFGGEVDEDWENTIERALEAMGDWEWMRCPWCMTSYI
jgi:hypothetical protein